MTGRSTLTFVRLFAVAIVPRVIIADATCYYPNGAVATQEKPCSSAEGSACCPDKWQCLDNGLCHYEPNDLYGSYSCTDQSWEAEGCPSSLCTYDMQRPGGESIKQCSSHNNQWCCNADDTHVHCCEESPSPRPFYDLPQGKQYAIIGTSTASSAPNLATVTMLASGSASGGGSSSTPPPSSSAAPSSNSGSSQSSSAPASSKTPDPVTSKFTSVSSGTAGPQTIIVTSVIQPPETNTPTASSSSGSHSNIGVIVGCAVGIPLALALAGILFWLFRKRSQQKKANPYDEVDPYNDQSPTLNGSSDFAGGAKMQKPKTAYAHHADPNVAELPSQSVGPERPISTIKGKAELETGGGYAPGTVPHNPNLVGVGGGNANGHSGHTPASSWGSAPPGYSPGITQQASHGSHDGAVEADGTAVSDHTGQTTEGGRYIPYRPPQDHAAAKGGHLSDVPEMAELSAVRTPPT